MIVNNNIGNASTTQHVLARFGDVFGGTLRDILVNWVIDRQKNKFRRAKNEIIL